MLLRTPWCRRGVQRLLERSPVFVLSCVSGPIQRRGYERQTRTQTLPTSGTCPRNCHLNNQQYSWTPRYGGCILYGSQSHPSSLLACPGTLTKCTQKRLYSTNLVKSVLTSGLKPATAPGKRIPKAPRTKQPSRTNPLCQDDDKVLLSTLAS